MLTAALIAFRFLLSAWKVFPRRLSHIPSLPLFACFGTAIGFVIVFNCAYWPDPNISLAVDGLILNRVEAGSELAWAQDTETIAPEGEIPPELYPISVLESQPFFIASGSLPLDVWNQSVETPRSLKPPPKKKTFPAKVKTKKPSPPGVDGIYHVVQRNENLWNIAQAYGVSHSKVVAYNQSIDPQKMIPNKDRVFIPHAKKTIALARSTHSMIKPLPSRLTWIKSGYGYRKHPIGGAVRFHHGVDMPASLNTPIYSVLDGTVVSVNNNTRSVKGRYVVISHANGLKTVYGHCNRIYVKRGQRVKQGSKIAAVGRTGRSTGYHLHFEVHKNGRYQNPERYLPKVRHTRPHSLVRAKK